MAESQIAYNQSIKVWTSCLRNPSISGTVDAGWHASCGEPSPGRLVLCRILDVGSRYISIENEHGREVRLYPGDYFVGVLGARRSSLNANGVVPTRLLAVGDRLALVSASGIVAEPVSGSGERLTNVEVQGFLAGETGTLARTAPPRRHLGAAQRESTVVAVVGTSAEAGKTTTACAIARALRPRPVAMTKLVGTGRMRDLFSYRDAGALHTTDFVDYGLASTYDIDEHLLELTILEMIADAQSNAEIVVVEVGGDTLEPSAQVALRALALVNACAIVCAGDAAGASFCIQQLEAFGLKTLAVSCFRQSQAGMSHRLSGQIIMDVYDEGAGALLSSLLKQA